MQKLNQTGIFSHSSTISFKKTLLGDEKKIFPALFSQNTIFVKNNILITRKKIHLHMQNIHLKVI